MSIKKQISRFILVGVIAVLIDFGVYTILLEIFNYSLSKALSFLSGACFAYLANKFFTFNKPHYSRPEIIKFSILYFSTLLANVVVNKLSLLILFYIQNWLQLSLLNEQIIILLAFLAATATSTILNFIGQKFWVFKL